MEEKYIGNYRILEKIGAGGMAKVYLAVHKDVPNLKVVLKVLSDSRLAERFKQEADKLALLDEHPNICKIKHFFNHGDEFVIAMEHINGPTLDEMIKEKGKLSIQESIRITLEILSILESAHSQGICHRDIKPGNVMLDKSGRVKIIDFGIAKGDSDPNLTIAGTTAGTPLYMAPEQFASGDNIDYCKSDIYAVGSNLFKMVTGDLPFSGDNEFALRDAKLFNDPVKPSSINSEVSKDLEKIILKSIERDASDRFQSASEMIESLKNIYEGGQVEHATKVETTVTKTATVQMTPTGKKSSKVPIIIGVVLLAIVVFLGVKFFAPDDEPDNNPIETNTGEEIADESVAYSDTANEMIVDDEEGTTTLNEEIPQNLIEEDNGDGNTSEEIAVNDPPADETAIISPGKLLIGSRPRGGTIYLNGILKNEQTPFTFEVDPGEYIIKVELEIDGRERTFIDTVNIDDGGYEKVLFKP